MYNTIHCRAREVRPPPALGMELKPGLESEDRPIGLLTSSAQYSARLEGLTEDLACHPSDLDSKIGVVLKGEDGTGEEGQLEGTKSIDGYSGEVGSSSNGCSDEGEQDPDAAHGGAAYDGEAASDSTAEVGRAEDSFGELEVGVE